MKVSYSKGVATHTDPESCVRSGNRAREALTGARAGQVLSRERKIQLREADVVVGSEGNTQSFINRENDFAPAWSETLCTYGSY